MNELATELDDVPLQFYLHGIGNMQAAVDMKIEAAAHEEWWRK